MAERLLRLTILVQAFGLTCALVLTPLETEQDLYGLLYFDWDWPEAVAQRIEDWGAVASLGAAAVVVALGFRAADSESRQLTGGWLSVAMLVYIAVFQLLLAATKTWRGDWFMSDMIEWTVAEQATRILAPVALCWMIIGCRDAAVPGGLRLPLAGALTPLAGSAGEWTLRVAASLTFFAHGLKSVYKAPQFVSLILGSGENLLGWSIPQRAAETALQVIGSVDICLAILLVSTRWRWVAWYMAIWGAITAFSRMTALGWEWYPETLVRAANCGVPLTLAILWSTRTPRASEANP
jgi:hypothetical protein